MTDDLITWLRVQLDDEERVATDNGRLRAAVWTALPAGGRNRSEVVTASGALVAEPMMEWDARHIARHDPARVLAEVDAKRRILDAGASRSEHESPGEYIYFGGWSSCTDDCPGTVWYEIVKLLALPFADRPGYRDEWKP